MIHALKMFYTTVGRKMIMALTGLFLVTFLIEHLYGNLLLYKLDGGVAFNEYSEFLVSSLFIRVVEIALFAGFLIHIIDGIYLTLYNRRARKIRYEVEHVSGLGTWFSRNMGLTGAVIFFFLVVHLKSFFVPYRIFHTDTSLAYEVASAFRSNWYAALYVVSMVILGSHLNHGFQSAFHSLGFNNIKYMKPMKTLGTLFALIMMIGFASFPIMFYFDIFGVGTDILGH
ncbi:MAG: succinate dehydrogenase cytochrome b subunit [Bacteroidia bacterium]|nr:succinate dehydrogenase cytochrome b subunit [Bacteroidia bacterium]